MPDSDRDLKLTSEVKDCPWCPKPLQTWRNLFFVQASDGEWAVTCHDCGSIGPAGFTKDDARRFWNSRPEKERAEIEASA